MNLDRIRSSVDVDTLQRSHVTVVGGAFGLARDLVRTGVGAITLVDFGVVKPQNPARQDFGAHDVGARKVDATGRDLLQINPDLELDLVAEDFCTIPRDSFDAHFGATDLFVLAPDQHPPNARGNLEVLRLGKPAIWIGLYKGARAGEIIFHVPDVTPACYRCITGTRYASFDAGTAAPESDGGTILDLRLVDAIAGQLAVGILTRGADNRFGKLVDALGSRNLLQIKIAHDYTLNERDIFAEQLGTRSSNFSFSTIAMEMQRDPKCPDCARLHTHSHEEHPQTLLH